MNSIIYLGQGLLAFMELIVVENIGERALLSPPIVRTVDDEGKIPVGVRLAGKEVLLIVLKPVPGDIEDYKG